MESNIRQQKLCDFFYYTCSMTPTSDCKCRLNIHIFLFRTLFTKGSLLVILCRFYAIFLREQKTDELKSEVSSTLFLFVYWLWLLVTLGTYHETRREEKCLLFGSPPSSANTALIATSCFSP